MHCGYGASMQSSASYVDLIKGPAEELGTQ